MTKKDTPTTLAPDALARLEQELAQLTQAAEREKATSLDAADRRAQLLQQQAGLATELARVQKILADDEARVQYEQAQEVARIRAAERVERQGALDAATAHTEGCLQQVEHIAAAICTAVKAALDAASSEQTARNWLDQGNAGSNLHAFTDQRRRISNRLAYLLKTAGGLGTALEHQTSVAVLWQPLAALPAATATPATTSDAQKEDAR